MSIDVNPASVASEKEYEAPPVRRAEHAEGSFTRLIEQQAAKIPSHVFLFSSLCSMGVSLGLELMGRERPARFIGSWVSPLLVMGVYNKLVKMLGPR
ncbi:hypothetical protein LZ198_09835 [Myxococcus sp. K15C18031901]|uniref:hypothetical protein n=1 Tax=Myxococcus dinghuensis TaxID=2906761 RepID=UPI0020A81826|nr:hypothetical protein [Myxococcus dinghuensis]MCP3099168.1 hypothetical protein [Myxococcus dinghuensis]